MMKHFDTDLTKHGRISCGHWGKTRWKSERSFCTPHFSGSWQISAPKCTHCSKVIVVWYKRVAYINALMGAKEYTLRALFCSRWSFFKAKQTLQFMVHIFSLSLRLPIYRLKRSISVTSLDPASFRGIKSFCKSSWTFSVFTYSYNCEKLMLYGRVCF